jgi:hypothetical protein
VIGGEGDYSGRLESLGNLRDVAVANFLTGGGGEYSGTIVATRTLMRGAVGADIEGGVGDRSGAIFAQRINLLLVGGSLVGGSGEGAGYVEAGQMLVRTEVGGDLQGAAGIRSGSIFSQRNPRRVEIGGASIPRAGAQSGRLIVPPRQTANQNGGSNQPYGLIVTAVGGPPSQGPPNDSIGEFPPSIGTLPGLPPINVNPQLPSSVFPLSSPLLTKITLMGDSPGILPEGFSIGENGELTVVDGLEVYLANGTLLPPGVYTSENFPPQ